MKDTHISEGILKAYLDQEVTADESSSLEQHLELCSQCQEILADLRLSSQQMSHRLNKLSPDRSAAHLTSSIALIHFEKYRFRKEVTPMFKNLLLPRFRSVWIGLGLVLLIGLSLAFPSVRAIANSFLGLFRIQTITVVQVDPGNLPEQLQTSTNLEAFFAEDIQAEVIGEQTLVNSLSEASALLGFAARIPVVNKLSPQLEVYPGAKISMELDLSKARLLLAEIGRQDIQVPELLDGSLVTVEIPRMLIASFGDCPSGESYQGPGYDPSDPDDTSGFERCTVFTQLHSPTIDAPPGLDVTRIGEAFLQLMGMTPEEAAHFSQNIDWATTLVIPVPRQANATFQDMAVDGVTGTLIRQEMAQGQSRYLLLWVKNEVVYALSGPGNTSTAASIANTLK